MYNFEAMEGGCNSNKVLNFEIFKIFNVSVLMLMKLLHKHYYFVQFYLHVSTAIHTYYSLPLFNQTRRETLLTTFISDSYIAIQLHQGAGKF